ncbi:MAG: IPT/TIG domain-containing protein, partial [Chloroflexales bacterium]
MANISRDTYNRIKHYVSVRLQQGVPLVDADWNEMEDIRRFELQAFLKWYVGDGVPYGDDGFRISIVYDRADFYISTGRCLVGGWDVMNDGLVERQTDGTWVATTERYPIQYNQQRLVKEVDLWQAWGVARMDKFTTPPTDTPRLDLVYLDTWEREVNDREDPDLVNPAISIPTCVRLKREWVVRVAPIVDANLTDFAVQAESFLQELRDQSDPQYQGHAYYCLARIEWDGNSDPVFVDLRRTGISLIDLERRIRVLERRVLAPAFAPQNQFTPREAHPETPVTIAGSNFDIPGLRVLFGTVVAEVIGTPSATQIIAKVPPTLPLGNAIKITVTTDGGSIVSDESFTMKWLAPTFSGSQFTPSEGLVGATITLTGSNFNAPGLVVKFAGTLAQIAPNTTPSATQIQVTVPNLPPSDPVIADPTITVETVGGRVMSTARFKVTSTQ